jgi:hypothetical protein
LITTAVPRVGAAKIFLGQHLNVLDRASGGDVTHATTYLNRARWIVGIRDGDRHSRVARDIADFDVRLHAVDKDVRAVDIDSGVRHLWRPVRHRGGEAAQARLAKQREHVVRKAHGDLQRTARLPQSKVHPSLVRHWPGLGRPLRDPDTNVPVRLRDASSSSWQCARPWPPCRWWRLRRWSQSGGRPSPIRARPRPA